MPIVKVEAPEQANTYDIHIGHGLLKKAAGLLERCRGHRAMIVTDENVAPLYLDAMKAQLEAAGAQASAFVLPAGETTKCMAQLERIYDALIDAHITRQDFVVALGGGVVGDIAGYAACTYLRGVRFIQAPTTLLAQVDSSVGGKVAVNHPRGKNLLGAFYQPELVMIDCDTLKTLDARQVGAGLGEVIKYGCIWDADLFKNLEAHTSFEDLKKDLTEVIYRCVDIKRIVVEHDQFDTSERMLLNFGHTLAHTIEQHYHYTRESHGEAVAIGMYQITKIAEEMGLTKPGEAEHIRKVLDIYGLPHKCDLMLHDLIGAIALDKKNLGGKLNVVLLKEIGKSYTYPTTTEFFTEHDRMV